MRQLPNGTNIQMGKEGIMEASNPFGVLPVFSMNLGIVAPPKAPISRYVYAGGIGEDTR